MYSRTGWTRPVGSLLRVAYPPLITLLTLSLTGQLPAGRVFAAFYALFLPYALVQLVLTTRPGFDPRRPLWLYPTLLLDVAAALAVVWSHGLIGTPLLLAAMPVPLLYSLQLSRFAGLLSASLLTIGVMGLQGGYLLAGGVLPRQGLLFDLFVLAVILGVSQLAGSVADQNAARAAQAEEFARTVQGLSRRSAELEEQLAALTDQVNALQGALLRQVRPHLAGVLGYVKPVWAGGMGQISPAQAEHLGQALNAAEQALQTVLALARSSPACEGRPCGEVGRGR